MKTTYARGKSAVTVQIVDLLDVFKLKGRCPLQQATTTTTTIKPGNNSYTFWLTNIHYKKTY